MPSKKAISIYRCYFCKATLLPCFRSFIGKWDRKELYYVQCKICRAQGPLAESVKECAELWNKPGDEKCQTA